MNGFLFILQRSDDDLPVLSALAEDLQVLLVRENAVAGGVGGFFQDAQRLQLLDSGGGGVIADAQSGSGSLDVDDGVLLQKVKYSPDIILAP